MSMNKANSERRLAENEVVFRQANEKVASGLKELKRSAETDGHDSLIPEIDTPLHFYCECADEDCQQRIILKPSKYKELHQNRSRFVIVPGHEVTTIERVVNKTDNYMVVEKNKTPPETDGELNTTSLNMS